MESRLSVTAFCYLRVWIWGVSVISYSFLLFDGLDMGLLAIVIS